jgi:hypothetical protein
VSESEGREWSENKSESEEVKFIILSDMHWFPAKRQAGGGTEIFVVACTDGIYFPHSSSTLTILTFSLLLFFSSLSLSPLIHLCSYRII